MSGSLRPGAKATAWGRSSTTQENAQARNSTYKESPYYTIAKSVVPETHRTNTGQIKIEQRSSYLPNKLANVEYAASCVGSIMSYTDKGKVNTNWQSYALGDIIRVPHVVPSLESGADLRDDHVGYTENTGPVVGKLRPAIVVGIYPSGLTCIPVCSSGGKGYSKMDAEDCLWIRQWNDDSEIWDGINESQYLLVADPHRASTSSYINLTQSFPISYKYPIKPMGHLTKASWSRLKELWMITLEKGFCSVRDQEVYARAEIKKVSLVGELRRVREAQMQKQAVRRADKDFVTVSYMRDGRRR